MTDKTEKFSIDNPKEEIFNSIKKIKVLSEEVNNIVSNHLKENYFNELVLNSEEPEDPKGIWCPYYRK